MENLETLTRLVCQIAHEAGSYIRQERQRFSDERVERKHAHDYVSYVDKASEQFLVERLRPLVPSATFLTEEGTTLNLGTPNSKLPTWVIDPLDGTTNFIHGYSPYAVSIALIQGDSILLGVVYDVTTSECFYAWTGGGAWLQSDFSGALSAPQPLRVSTRVLDDALLCLQLPYNSDAYKPVIQRLISHFYGRVASIRMIGSAALALCWVAAGRLDGYAERYICPWDFMAGALIVSEAGGRVTDYAGADDLTQGDSILAANSHVHPYLLHEVQE